MRARFISKSLMIFIATSLMAAPSLVAQGDTTGKQLVPFHVNNMIMLFILLVVVLAAAIFLKIKTSEVIMAARKKKEETDKARFDQYISNMAKESEETNSILLFSRLVSFFSFS